MGSSAAAGQRGLAQKRSAISLHDQRPIEPYSDEPSDDPPAYTDANATDVSALPDIVTTERYIYNPYPDISGGRLVDTLSRRESYVVTLSPEYSTDPECLYDNIFQQALIAPTVLISVKGTHSVKERDGNNKKSSSTVTDFDFRIETRGTILPISSYRVDRDPQFDFYRTWNVVRDDIEQSAYRGGRFKSKSSKRYKAPVGDLEQAHMLRADQPPTTEGHQATLKQWCQRFCEDKSGVKSFTLRRKVTSLNFDLLKHEITSVIRATNYRGSIHVNLITTHTAVTVYSPHMLNGLRTNRFVWWAVVILQLWIFAWPLLILLEKRYEPVEVEHHVCRAGDYCPPFEGEDAWTKMFAPAISAAALGRRKDGEIVTVNDIERARNSTINGGARLEESPAERDRRARLNTGNGSFMDSLVGIARGVSELRNEYDHARGWGQNE
ncbi:uncharacterized protein GIQ15_02914 [Arthroderma uncinatum]|uniref:uncharacterized protein n=1 Tax=Arthroderma uncinatum TaxID=74035 RepID=UPI00144ABBDF|nr:uncharacterized protein GIQ15_02914 [Arthroderma uncinatum]KAF3483590.1 hypothetical protein GIQ15_02914 [Arthroderma uncinatum]